LELYFNSIKSASLPLEPAHK